MTTRSRPSLPLALLGAACLGLSIVVIADWTLLQDAGDNDWLKPLALIVIGLGSLAALVRSPRRRSTD